MDNKRETENDKVRIPGKIGWAIERPELNSSAKIITDDTRFKVYPVEKKYISEIDR